MNSPNSNNIYSLKFTDAIIVITCFSGLIGGFAGFGEVTQKLENNKVVYENRLTALETKMDLIYNRLSK